MHWQILSYSVRVEGFLALLKTTPASLAGYLADKCWASKPVDLKLRLEQRTGWRT